MSNPNSSLAAEYVYTTLFGVLSEHVTTHVNGTIMTQVEEAALPHYANFRYMGISDEYVKVAGALALRDAWRTKVQVDNMSPENFL